MNTIERSLERLSQWLSWLAYITLVAMMFLVVFNIVLRIIYKPILGTYEIVGFLCALTISLGLAQTTIKQGHVTVDVFVSFFGRKTQNTIIVFSACLSVLLFAALSWQGARYALDIANTGQLSPTLRIPYHPLVYGFSVACAITCLVLTLEIAKSIGRGRE